jgi:hypothetical protein
MDEIIKEKGEKWFSPFILGNNIEVDPKCFTNTSIRHNQYLNLR